MQKLLTDTRRNRYLDDMKPLSLLLIEWQNMLHLNDVEAASRCEMTRQQWWELKSGRTSDPRSSTLRKLTQGTGIPVERLTEAAHVERLAGTTA